MIEMTEDSYKTIYNKQREGRLGKIAQHDPGLLVQVGERFSGIGFPNH